MNPSPRLIAVLRKVLLSVAVSVTLLAAFVMFENERGARGWRTTVAELTARGERLEVAGFRSPQVNDDENFFRAPLLSRILYVQSEDQERSRILSEARLSDFRELARFGADFRDFVSLHAQLARNQTLKVPTSGNPAADILAAMAPLRALLDDLRQAGETRPKAVLGWNEAPLSSPRIAADTIHAVGMLLAFRAKLEVELGQVDAAYADIVALQRMANGILTAPNVIQVLVGASMHRAAADVVGDGCRKRVWTDSRLARFQRLLAEFHPVGGFRDAIVAERAVVLYFVDNPPPSPAFGVDWPWWLFPGWVQQNKRVYCRALEERILLRLQSSSPRILPGADPGSPHTDDRGAKFPSPFGWLARLCLGNVERILDNYGATAEELNVTLVAWAAERHRLARGRYPKELSELGPEFLAQPPLAILNGLPVRLRRSPDGKLKVYSVGPDAHDDGGAKDDVAVEVGG